MLALLFLPAAAALPWCRRLPTALLLAVGVGLVMLAAGFIVSSKMEWPLSHSVGGVGVGMVALSMVRAVR